MDGSRLAGARTLLGLAVDVALRGLYPLLALGAVWGVLLWGPWPSAVGFFAVFHVLRYAEQHFGAARPLPPERRLRRTRLLAHPEDIHVVVYMLLYWAGLASAFAIYLGPESGAWTPADRVGFCLAAGLWLGLAGAVNTGINYHSHTHRGIFKSRWLNRWVGRVWTIPGGFPAFFWSYKHLVVHHKHLHEQADWVQPKRAEDGRYENLYRYILLYWPWRWARHFYVDFSRAKPAVRRRAIRELVFFLVCWSLPFFVDVTLGLGIWFFHQWVSNVGVMGPGMYAQHAGGTNERRLSHSNTFLCAFFNKTMFNAGFHIEHTARPGVHWSELPALHESMKDELIADGAHVLPYGIFKGAGLLSSVFNPDAGYEQFMRGEPDSGRPEESPRVMGSAG
ncbi:fatty acid desaturase [Corallococcus silvisoli]|uniref:fatty acid desaturase n=1 Tax=Corallococcus silvisoli TaxID=2697031 RepID=UPI0013776D0C|nr:fatty acid desaturase [Corallococcus silvisoli]NBD13077.1 hypothetical protein [Corallococcus silvisoli]